MKDSIIARNVQQKGKAVANTLNTGMVKTKPVLPQIHTKLSIGQPNDIYEKEADAVADRVMSMPESAGSENVSLANDYQEAASRPVLRMISPFIQKQATEEEREEEIQTKKLIQRQEIEEEEDVQAKPDIQRQEEEEEKEEIQAKFQNNENLINANHIIQPLSSEPPLLNTSGGNEWFSQELANSKNSGSPLPENTRSDMEARFGADFSNVRVHTGSNAVTLSRSINAQAFTTGNDIYFNSGKFEPGTNEGKHLLAHELTHTIQQTGKSGPLQQNKIQRIPANLEDFPFVGTIFKNAILREGPDKTTAALDTLTKGTSVLVVAGGEYLNVVQFLPVFRTGYVHASLISRGTSFTNITDTGNRYTSNLTLYNNTIEITKKVNFVDGGGFTSPNRLNRLKRRIKRAISSYLSRKFSLKVSTPPPGKKQAGDKTYPIVVYITEDPAGYSVTLMGNAHGGSFATTGGATLYELGQASETYLRNIVIAHEAAHFVLGQSDEYTNSAVSGRVVYTDNSLLGNFYNEGISRAKIKARHFQFIIPVVQPWFPGRNLTIV